MKTKLSDQMVELERAKVAHATAKHAFEEAGIHLTDTKRAIAKTLGIEAECRHGEIKEETMIKIAEGIIHAEN